MERPSSHSSLGFELLTISGDGNADVNPGKSRATSAHAAIDTIPPELLSKIFLVCVALWPTRDDSDYFKSISEPPSDFTCGDYLPWIAIAQVSRYWRSVALGCGELWRELLFSSPKATSEMLRRSKGVSLVVKAKIRGYLASDVCKNVRMVIPEIERVSVLHLCFPAKLLHPLLHDIFVASPKPRVESLRLSTHDGYDFDPFPPFVLPDGILTKLSPSLRRLELTSCQFSWQSLPLRGLTHLELRKPASKPTMAQIVSLLRAVPVLNTVILDRVLPTHLPNHIRSDLASPRQFFPHLRVLTLRGTVNSCIYVLRHISYPIATIATIDCDIPSRETVNFYKLFLEAHSAVGDSDHIIHSLALRRTYHPHLFLRCLVARRSSSPDPSVEPPQLNVILRWDGRPHSPFSVVLRAAVAALPLAEVRTLHVSSMELSVLEWTEFLKHLRMTHTIHFHRWVPAELMKAIVECGDTMVSAEPATHLLPCLRSLHFRGVEFAGSWKINLKQALLTYLQSRIQGGSAIEELHLSDCYELYRDDVERMKDLVQDVDWDEVEQQEEEYPETGHDFEGIDNSD